MGKRTKVTYFCDRCGREHDEPDFLQTLQIPTWKKDWSTGDGLEIGGLSAELCSDCIVDYVNMHERFVDSFMKAEKDAEAAFPAGEPAATGPEPVAENAPEAPAEEADDVMVPVDYEEIGQPAEPEQKEPEEEPPVESVMDRLYNRFGPEDEEESAAGKPEAEEEPPEKKKPSGDGPGDDVFDAIWNGLSN